MEGSTLISFAERCARWLRAVQSRMAYSVGLSLRERKPPLAEREAYTNVNRSKQYLQDDPTIQLPKTRGNGFFFRGLNVILQHRELLKKVVIFHAHRCLEETGQMAQAPDFAAAVGQQ